MTGRGGTAASALGGVLVVDKPRGPTSHDVVARVRRALSTKRVGHAGTLDPMASGVLVVLVGEATKLAPYLTANDKTYRASVALGISTDTGDADGKVVERCELPDSVARELASIDRSRTPAYGRDPTIARATDGPSPGGSIAGALATERARTEQVPPAHSAVRVDGVRSYDRARAGEVFELAPRRVEVRRLEILGASMTPPRLEIELSVSKGYYVRAFARDVGRSLGVPAHLDGLRRTASGPFAIAEAVALEAVAPAYLVTAVAAATRALGSAELTAEGALRARDGKKLSGADFETLPDEARPTAWTRAGRLVAIGERVGEGFAILRGFSDSTNSKDGT